jgi:hypothetical protein
MFRRPGVACLGSPACLAPALFRVPGILVEETEDFLHRFVKIAGIFRRRDAPASKGVLDQGGSLVESPLAGESGSLRHAILEFTSHISFPFFVKASYVMVS